jgi:hypothetical protein
MFSWLSEIRAALIQAADDFEDWYLLLFGFFAAMAFVCWYLNKTHAPFPVVIRRP